jgi:hypothetical protein
MADIKQNYKLKFFFKCVIFRSKILQKLRIFHEWAMWMRHQVIEENTSFNLLLGNLFLDGWVASLASFVKINNCWLNCLSIKMGFVDPKGAVIYMVAQGDTKKTKQALTK